MGASLRTAWSASGATGASDSNVFVHEDVDFSYEEIFQIPRPKRFRSRSHSYELAGSYATRVTDTGDL